MIANTENKVRKNNVLNLVFFRFLPYWPLFLLLILVCCVAAWYKVHYLTPLYEASTTILVKDDKQGGGGDSKVLESLNLISSNKNLENEVELLSSKSMMKEVVKALGLYAPVFEEGDIISNDAYVTTPILIKVKDPDHLIQSGNIFFEYNPAKSTVRINNKNYGLDTWYHTPYGELMFVKNSKQQARTPNPLYFTLVQPGNIAGSYRSRLTVYAGDHNSSVITLNLKDNVPQRAEDVLNTLADVYSKASVADKNALAVNTLAFLEDRIKYIENELDSVERKIQGYKSDKGIVDLSEQGKMFLDQVSSNDKRVADINVQLALLDQAEKYVIQKNNKNGIVPASLSIKDPLLDGLLQQLYSAEVKYEKLKKTGAENNPALITLKSEIDQIRPSILENIKNQRASLITSMHNINAASSSYESVLTKIPKQEKDLLDFSRREAIKSSVYTFLLQKREETALSLSGSISDTRVIDAAEAHMIPNSPGKTIIYLMAIGLGIILGVCWVTIKDFASTKVKFRSEIEESTTIPVVAELAKADGKSDFVVNDPDQLLIAEQFRQLRAAIGLYGKTSNKIKLLVTSNVSGEGKSFVSLNMAMSLAIAGKKVLLIDLDLRNPKLSEKFGFQEAKGVADFLEGNAEISEIIRQTSIERLYLSPAGAGEMNPTELLLNGKVDVLFQNVSEWFDYIIIDSSPVEPVTDAYVLSNYCDAVLYVIRHGFTPKTALQLLDDSNKIKTLKRLAIVFNGIKSRGFTKMGYGYGYGYGYENVYLNKIYTRGKSKMLKSR